MPYRFIRRRARKDIERLDESRLQSLAAAHGIRDPESYTREQLIRMVERESEEFARGELLAFIAIALVIMFPLVIGSGLIESSRIHDTQNRLRDVACAQAEQSIAAPLIRNPDTQTLVQWVRSLQARSNYLATVVDVGCPGEAFEDRRQISLTAINNLLARLYAQQPELNPMAPPTGGGGHKSSPISGSQLPGATRPPPRSPAVE